MHALEQNNTKHKLASASNEELHIDTYSWYSSAN